MNIDEIPSEPHWAIFTTESVYIPGDERSRTNPGHGYPAHTDHYINYEVFTDPEAWKAAIKQCEQRGVEYKAAHIEPATVELEVKVKVS